MHHLSFFIVVVILVSSSHALAQEPEFDTNNSYGTEEVTTKSKGQKIRKVKTGRLRPSIQTEAVGSIYEGDVERLERRIRSRRFWSVGFGPYALTNSKSGADQAMIYGGSVARHWEASSRGEIRVRVSGAGGSAGSFASAGLGGAFMPVRSSVSPLLGAEFGGGFSSGERSGGGFTVSGYGGMRLFRLSDAQLELLGSYTAVLAQNAVGAFGMQLGILF